MIDVGSDVLVNKTEERFSAEEVPHGVAALTVGTDPDATANKVRGLVVFFVFLTWRVVFLSSSLVYYYNQHFVVASKISENIN